MEHQRRYARCEMTSIYECVFRFVFHWAFSLRWYSNSMRLARHFGYSICPQAINSSIQNGYKQCHTLARSHEQLKSTGILNHRASPTLWTLAEWSCRSQIFIGCGHMSEELALQSKQSADFFFWTVCDICQTRLHERKCICMSNVLVPSEVFAYREMTANARRAQSTTDHDINFNETDFSNFDLSFAIHCCLPAQRSHLNKK